MVKLDLSQIKTLCTEASFERGKRYLEEGRVRIKEASPSKLVATVAGTDNYRVEIALDHLSATCTCPYDWEGYCKHIIAALLARDKEHEAIKSMMERSSSELKQIEAMLEKTELEALRNFLRREMERLPDLKARFMACFSTGGEGKSVSEYKEEIRSLYHESGDHGFVPYGEEIDFTPFEDLAEIYSRKGEFLEAAKIYQALTETIAEKMDDVDDSDGYYGGEFTDFLEAFADCINEGGLGSEAKRVYIKYLFGKYLKNDPDYFREDYEEALETLCTSDEDLRYWKELLEPHLLEELPDKEDWSGYYHAKELISMQLYILSKLGENAEFYPLMEKYYRSSADFSLRYAEHLLKDGDREKAVRVAEEGLSLFPDYSSMGLKQFLSEVYRDTDPAKYKDMLLSLFFQNGEWKYYEGLKMASSQEEWHRRLEEITKHYSQDRLRREKLIDIYLREQMFDAASKGVLITKSILVLKEYQKELADKYPKECFNAYRELIYPFAESEMGRKHYRDVVSYLKMMKTIKGFEVEVQEIVERLRDENKRKPAFIDEMKNL